MQLLNLQNLSAMGELISAMLDGVCCIKHALVHQIFTMVSFWPIDEVTKVSRS